MAERAGESERAEEGDDRRGQGVSERERENTRAGVGADGPRCWATQERARARGQAVRLGRAGGRKESRPERKVLFSFFKNVNSSSICLFRLKFCRAPKLVKIFV
jgi:hypothetical protein